MTDKTAAKPGRNAKSRRPKPAAEELEGILRQRTQFKKAVQFAREDPGSLSTGDVLHLQRAVGNRAVSRLVNKLVEPAYPNAKRDNHRKGKNGPSEQTGEPVVRQSSNRLGIQRKLQLTGGNKKIRAKFMKKMNAGTSTKFEIDGSGFIKLKNPKAKGSEEYARKMIMGIKDAQTVKLKLIKKDDTVFVDSFASGEVDYNDMFKMSQTMFKLNLLHFVVERFAIKDYETKKATATGADFAKAHKAGLESEEKYLKQLFPGKTIKYKSAGFDPKSKKVDKAGNGTIRYIFDFTDVKEIFIQPIVGGAVKENIVKTIVKVVK